MCDVGTFNGDLEADNAFGALHGSSYVIQTTQEGHTQTIIGNVSFFLRAASYYTVHTRQGYTSYTRATAKRTDETVLEGEGVT